MKKTSSRENQPERIFIEGFLGLPPMQLDLSPITVLIGPHGTGKSVCAKLVHLFRDYPTQLFQHAQVGKTVRQADEEWLRIFRRVFKEQYWKKTPFSIRYEIGSQWISLVLEKSDLRLTTSAYYRTWFSQCKKEIPIIFATVRGRFVNQEFYDALAELFVNAQARLGIQAGLSQLFIPAVRTYFAMLQNNIFTFLQRNQDLDPLLIEFGGVWEQIKKTQIWQYRSPEEKVLHQKLQKKAFEILHGEFLHLKEDDFLKLENGRSVKLIDASSGQQEAVPMIQSLVALPFRTYGSRGFSVSIEEPETHLFPSAQRAIVELISTLLNHHGKYDIHFFLTTHSPYLLTALNNGLQAGLIRDQMPEEWKKVTNKYINEEHVLKPGSVNAYSLDDRGCHRIIDDETGLILADAIDEVSSQIAIEFDGLLEFAFQVRRD